MPNLCCIDGTCLCLALFDSYSIVWFPNPLAAGSDFFKSDGDPVYFVIDYVRLCMKKES